MSVPPGLEWWREEPDGFLWLQHLPDIVGECARLWSLEVGEPFHNAHVSYVAPVELRDGTSAVLKINFPEPESEHEADALAHWDGDGAVRLLGSLRRAPRAARRAVRAGDAALGDAQTATT